MNLLTGTADRLKALRGWRRAVAALLAGASLAAAQAPLHVVPAAAIAFTALVWLLDGAPTRRVVLLTAWAFAYGFFVAGLYWTGISFFVDAERFAWLVPFPVLGLPALLAVFPGFGVALAWWWRPNGLARLFAVAVGWSAGEFGRSHLLTGFPWNLVGYVWTPVDATLQSVAVLGVHGLGLLTVLLAALPAALADAGRRRQGAYWLSGMALLFAAMTAAGAARLVSATAAEVPGVRLRLVQAGIDQYQKWQDDKRLQNLRRHVELSRRPGFDRVTHLIWPETAVPYFLDLEPGLRAELGGIVPNGGLLLTGAPRRTAPDRQPFQIWNSLQALDSTGRIAGTYDKRHLVPFGEYLPFRSLFGRLGIEKLTHGSVDFSSGNGAVVVSWPGLPPTRPLICYEGVFPEELAAAHEPRAAWLLNVTNDGWFGRSSGPYQHFAMTRVRAIEQGVPLVRAANTGISAIVDPYGRTVTRLDLGAIGVVDGPLPQAIDPPPYVRLGDWPAAGLWLLLVGLAWRSGRR